MKPYDREILSIPLIFRAYLFLGTELAGKKSISFKYRRQLNYLFIIRALRLLNHIISMTFDLSGNRNKDLNIDV